jgi:hypothetical protein
MHRILADSPLAADTLVKILEDEGYNAVAFPTTKGHHMVCAMAPWTALERCLESAMNVCRLVTFNSVSPELS